MSGPSGKAADQQGSDAKGRRAENIAALTLRFLGWRIVARRFTPERGSGAGEVDLIARKGQVVAFIEVKARPTLDDALAALSDAQKARIARGAEAWMTSCPNQEPVFMRFDLIAVPACGRPLHLADAWRPDF